MNWKEILSTQSDLDYFKVLKGFIKRERTKNTIFPSKEDVFNAFKLTPFDKIKVVIIGQDPYHGKNQAHGLSFSVPKGAKIPPSLQNIFLEIRSDLGIECKSGCLESWAKQGVLLLNSSLTVREGQAGSHQNRGWEIFTDFVIQEISEKKDKVVFILWGRFAQNKAYLIDQNKHQVLKAPHPSPYSANSGFFGCKHFSKCNQILESFSLQQIDWST